MTPLAELCPPTPETGSAELSEIATSQSVARLRIEVSARSVRAIADAMSGVRSIGGVPNRRLEARVLSSRAAGT